MNANPALRLTPSNSPFYKTVTPRSPSKINKATEEAGLRLRKVIGTTTATANGFDCLPTQHKFAYTAGAAAVIATVHKDLKVTQQFFRARPTTSAGARDGVTQWPVTPTPADPRNQKSLSSIREQTTSPSTSTNLGRDWADSPLGKSLTAKDRIKAATSVALSPNGKWLAIGESGYKPRVLIFRALDNTSEIPVCAVAEHTFGVHALAFSPDSRYLVSLGTVNDGFLYVWSIDDRSGAATLYASNKCTSTINSVTWMGRAVVTAGLRFIKVWRPDEDAVPEGQLAELMSSQLGPRNRIDLKPADFGNSILMPKHKVLSGKNSLLGDMLEANFVCVLALSDNHAIVCAESGEVCAITGLDRSQTLTVVGNAGFRVTAARLDGESNLHVLGSIDNVKVFSSSELQVGALQALKSDRRKTISPTKLAANDDVTVVATATIGHAAVELDSKGGIRLSSNSTRNADGDRLMSHQIPGHEDAVLGVHAMACKVLPRAAFFTLSCNGTIQIWDHDGASVSTLIAPIETTPEMDGMPNELKAAATLCEASVLAAGDRYGMLTIIDVKTKETLAQVRAHSAEIVDIATYERPGVDLIATASRDRTIQLFGWARRELVLVQTLDEHAGALSGLLFTPDGEHLMSCSADRTVVVRESMLRDEDDPTSVVFVILRTISLKSSPTSMCMGASHDKILVSTTDRSINNFNFRTGQAGFGFKCSDSEGGEAAVISKLLFAPSLNGNRTIIGVCSSDKSVRLYSEYGALIARDWGHTEGITDVALLESESHGSFGSATVVTVAADSTIFMWDTTPPPSAVRSTTEVDVIPELPKLPTMAPPLRKVLSHSELFRFRREKSVEDNDPASPPEIRPMTRATSPQRLLRKKSSRASIAQPPRLDAAFRSQTYDGTRRKSLRNRSPSPPSPRNANKRDLLRRPSLGIPLRSKSSEGMLSNSTSAGGPHSTGFGSLTASTDSVCRTLRAYRKKLANSSSSEMIASDVMRELEKELKLTARVLSQKSQGQTIDEATMARLLDQASEKIVEMLDERLKERVDSGNRKNNDVTPPPVTEEDKAEALAGIFEKVSLRA